MKKILIVDDEPNIVMALEYTFKKNNFEVFIARDGQEALDIVKSTFPDMIILDVMMPMVDGYATIEQIRKDKNLKHTKVIFLSAKNKESDIEKGMALGADAYLTKPLFVKLSNLETSGEVLHTNLTIFVRFFYDFTKSISCIPI